MRRLFTLFTILLLSASAIQLHAQLISVKTNALMDALTIVNGDISITTGNRTAISASVFGSQSVLGNQVKMWGVKPEFRYWISGRAHTGYFVGLSAVGASYNINWKKEIYKGDAFGGGVTIGYDFYLTKHFTLDVHGGFGAVYYRHQFYYEGDKVLKEDFKEHGLASIPYDLGVSIVYIFK